MKLINSDKYICKFFYYNSISYENKIIRLVRAKIIDGKLPRQQWSDANEINTIGRTYCMTL